MDLSRKVAVITGASRGLGAGLASDFAARGIRLGLCARQDPVLPDGDAVLARRVDVTDQDAVERFTREVLAQFERIDLWINNAGVLEPVAALHDVSAADFRHALEVNVMGVFHGTQAFVRHVRARPGVGVLVNISSGAARNGYAGWSAYCATKAAVDLMTESVQLEETAHGLRAYSVAPGIIDTDMQALIRKTSPEAFPMVEKFRKLKVDDAFSSTGWVAQHLIELAFGDKPTEGVRIGLPSEKTVS